MTPIQTSPNTPFIMAINRFFLLALIGLPVAIYFLLLGFYVLDLPKTDDYGDSLMTFNEIVQAENLKQKIQIFFTQHVDHRTTFSRSVYLFALMILGRFDYSLFIFIGNSALLIIALVMYRCLSQGGERAVSPWSMIPIVYLIFQPSAYVSMFWAMASLSNYFVMLWALLCFYFLTQKNTASLFISLAFAMLAAFTQGNGIACLPLGLCYLLLIRKVDPYPEVVRHLVIWSGIGAIILIGFSWGYHFRAPMELPVSAKGVTMKIDLELSFIAVFHWAAAIIGAAVAYGNLWLASTMGVIVIAGLGYFSLKKTFRHYPALSLYLVFILLSITMIAVLRSTFLDIQYSLSSRYTFYSAQLIAVLAAVASHRLLAQSMVKKSGPVLVMLCAVILMSSGNYFVYVDKIRQQQFQVLHGMWLWNNQERRHPYAPMVINAGGILTQARQNEIYSPPAISYLPPNQWGRFNLRKK